MHELPDEHCHIHVTGVARLVPCLEIAMQEAREITRECQFPAEPASRQLLGGWLVQTVLGIVCVGFLVTSIALNCGAERRAIRSLPADQRQQLYARTLQNLNTVCTTEQASMRDFCEDQARLLKAFPECDEACYRLADKQLFRVQSPR